MTPKYFNFQKTFYLKNYSYFNDLKNAPNFFGSIVVMTYFMFVLLRPHRNDREQFQRKEGRSVDFHEILKYIVATRTCLIGWLTPQDVYYLLISYTCASSITLAAAI